MLSSDIYRDYEADYGAASGAEEVQLQVEEEGWKQREADEEEGSGKLFTSSRHAFACYPHPRFLRTPELQRMAPLLRPRRLFPFHILFLKPHTLLFMKRLDFTIPLTTQRAVVRRAVVDQHNSFHRCSL